MSQLTIKVRRLTPTAIPPAKAHPGDLGFDLYADEAVSLYRSDPMQLVRTGIAIGFPPGWGGLILGRSGHASRGLAILGGCIDPGFVGEIKVMLASVGGEEFRFERGDRIAQLVLAPAPEVVVEEVESLETSARGDRGFGSTGR